MKRYFQLLSFFYSDLEKKLHQIIPILQPQIFFSRPREEKYGNIIKAGIISGKKIVRDTNYTRYIPLQSKISCTKLHWIKEKETYQRAWSENSTRKTYKRGWAV